MKEQMSRPSRIGVWIELKQETAMDQDNSKPYKWQDYLEAKVYRRPLPGEFHRTEWEKSVDNKLPIVYACGENTWDSIFPFYSFHDISTSFYYCWI